MGMAISLIAHTVSLIANMKLTVLATLIAGASAWSMNKADLGKVRITFCSR